MTTIIERQTGSADSSMPIAMIVGIVAILFIVGFGLFFLRAFPFNNQATVTPDSGTNINVEGQLQVPSGESNY